MLKRILNRVFDQVNGFLNRPGQVALVFFLIAVMSLVFDGTLFQLWTLAREKNTGHARIIELKKNISELDHKIARAEKLEFIEREARDRFDLAEEGDLVFVFTKDAQNELDN